MQSLYLPIVCLLLFFFIGCTEQEESVVSLEASSVLTEHSQIDLEETDDRFIGLIRSLSVGLDPFRLYIVDREMHRVAVVDSSGSIVDFIGSEGQGPGEFQSPTRAVQVGDSLWVEDGASTQVSVFTPEGVFERRATPETGPGGVGTLTAFEDRGYRAVFLQSSVAEGFQASPELQVAARLDDTFDVAQAFGAFPPLYQEDEYTQRLAKLDINRHGIAALGFNLVLNVHLHDLNDQGYPEVKRVQFDHEAFEKIDQPLPLGMTPEESAAIAHKRSEVVQTHLLSDTTVIQTFDNRTEAFHAEMGVPDRDEQTFYAALKHVHSGTTENVKLPGPILARDDNDRLYIELNHRPDERTIGVYEVNWP